MKSHNNISLKRILILLVVVAFISQAGNTITIPFMPQLLESLTGRTVEHNSFINGIMIAGYALCQFIFAPILASFSDKYGRKPIIILCLFVFSFCFFIMALDLNLYFLLFGRILSGICGASIAIIFTCILDFSPKEKSTSNLRFIYSGFGAGLILGPLIGGLLSLITLRFPFWAASVFCLLIAILFIFFFPETLEEKYKRANLKISNPLSVIYKIVTKNSLVLLAFAYLIYQACFQIPLYLWSFYAVEVFQWNIKQITYSLVFFGLSFMFVQLFVVKYTSMFFSNQTTILLGIVLGSIGGWYMAYSQNPIGAYIAIFVFSFCSISNPAFISYFNSIVPIKDQSAMQGVLSSIASISIIISSTPMNWLFKYSIEEQILFTKNNPFYLGVTLIYVTFILCTISFYLKNKKNKQ